MRLQLKASFLRMRTLLAQTLRDPLQAFRANGEKQLEVVRWLSQGLEVYLRAANKFGKTTLGARYFVAVARGKRTFLGIPIPRMPVPSIGMVLSLDYTQQQLSVQKAYLAALGEWPHEIRWVPGHHGRIVKSIAVRPDDWASDDPATWSQIHFYSQQNRRAGIGARGHWAHADEPPIEAVWREVRKAGEPGWPFLRLITATPTFRSLWWWLKQDFPLVPSRAEDGRVVVEASIYDAMRTRKNALGSISEREVRELEMAYKGDILRDARLFGRECNTEGASPFKRHYTVLSGWLDGCRAPMVEEWEVLREVLTPQGVARIMETVEVEIYADRRQGETYLAIIDPSRGIEDDLHDPGGIHVYSLRRFQLVARYNGYIGSYGLGILGSALAKEYGNALVDIDVTGGYGDAVLSALNDAGYRNIAHDTVPVAHGKARTTLGFTIGPHTRAQFVTAIQEALVASAAGHGYVLVESEDVVRNLLDMVMDKDGKPITTPGLHDEDFVLFGRACWRALRKGTPPERVRNEPTKGQLALDAYRRSIGLPPQRRSGRRVRPKPRRAPRGALPLAA